MRIRALICCLFLSLALTLSGCFGCNEPKPYSFRYDKSEISDISIIYTIDDYFKLREYETIIKIEDSSSFLKNFEELLFYRYWIGDPTEVYGGLYAILIKYNNGDFEIITYNAQDIVIDNKYYFGKVHCDEEEFNNFINSYISVET